MKYGVVNANCHNALRAIRAAHVPEEIAKQLNNFGQNQVLKTKLLKQSKRQFTNHLFIKDHSKSSIREFF